MFRSEGVLLIETVVKAIVAIVLVVAVAYSVVMQVPIPEPIMELIFLIMAVYYGFSAAVTGRGWRVVRKYRKQQDG